MTQNTAVVMMGNSSIAKLGISQEIWGIYFMSTTGLDMENLPNLIIYGENLKSLNKIKNDFKNKIHCICIDPPFNKNAFKHKIAHKAWLEMMRARLNILNEFMTQDGTIWISINDCECHYLKVLCDEVFSKENFLMSIILEKDHTKSNSNFICESHEYILCYAKNREISEKMLKQKFLYNTIWTMDEVGNTSEALKEIATLANKNDYPIPKSERLIARIIEIATNPGEIVLDCFGGSGTTAAVAHKMNRKWIIVEQTEQCLEQIVPRIHAIIKGEDHSGISQKFNWKGGGSYEFLEIA